MNSSLSLASQLLQKRRTELQEAKHTAYTTNTPEQVASGPVRLHLRDQRPAQSNCCPAIAFAYFHTFKRKHYRQLRSTPLGELLYSRILQAIQISDEVSQLQPTSQRTFWTFPYFHF